MLPLSLLPWHWNRRPWEHVQRGRVGVRKSTVGGDGGLGCDTVYHSGAEGMVRMTRTEMAVAFMLARIHNGLYT